MVRDVMPPAPTSTDSIFEPAKMTVGLFFIEVHSVPRAHADGDATYQVLCGS
jgi:hypothetical protein